jgi:hypothetical protein
MGLWPTKVVKNALCPATALPGSFALPFVIPTEAEGSAVPRTFHGNVFREGAAKWRDPLFLFSSHAPSLAHY